MNDADAVAIDVLSWLASEPELFNRFVGLSGIQASQIRQAATEPGFLLGVLTFLMGHEPTLLRYCESNNQKPDTINAAFRALGGQTDSN